jgi:hypothetical protein
MIASTEVSETGFAVMQGETRYLTSSATTH